MSNNVTIKDLLEIRIVWIKEPGVPKWRGLVKGERCELSMNDFPDKPLYTLLWQESRLDIDDHPKKWSGLVEPVFSAGFRLSTFDGMILLAGSVAATILGRVDMWSGLAVGFVIAHFFLFCNVLRMSRPLELAWAAAFSGLAVGAVRWGVISWPMVFGVSMLLTLVLVIVAVLRPSYHGVGWKRFNAGLPDWWVSNILKSSDRGPDAGN